MIYLDFIPSVNPRSSKITPVFGFIKQALAELTPLLCPTVEDITRFDKYFAAGLPLLYFDCRAVFGARDIYIVDSLEVFRVSDGDVEGLFVLLDPFAPPCFYPVENQIPRVDWRLEKRESSRWAQSRSLQLHRAWGLVGVALSRVLSHLGLKYRHIQPGFTNLPAGDELPKLLVHQLSKNPKDPNANPCGIIYLVLFSKSFLIFRC